MLGRFLTIARKEYHELVRDPVFLTMALIGPLVLYVLMGSGMVLDVEHIRVTVLDRDQSKLSRTYRRALDAADGFVLTKSVSTPDEAERQIQTGNVEIAVTLPPDFSRSLRGGEPTRVRCLIDGMYPYRASMINGTIQSFHRHYERTTLPEHIGESTASIQTPMQTVRLKHRAWFNPTMESKNFILPGLVVTTLMFYPALLVALVVVREKETGTIFNLYMSPAHTWEIIFGKILPYIGIVFVLFLLLFLVSVNLYDVRFVGSFPLLAAGAFLYIMSTLGIGLFISILSRSQLSAMLITFVATILPSFIYSGFMAPVTSKGIGGQIVSNLIPATHFMVIVRGIYLKDIPFRNTISNFLTLAVFCLLYYGLSMYFFTRKTD